MYSERLSRLLDEMNQHELNSLALMPGPNLFYLTGLSFHLSERPVLLLLFVNRAPAIIVPEFEAIKVEGTDIQIDIFSYTDEEGYTPAFQRACEILRLRSSENIIGAETFRMRMAELRLLERYVPSSQIVPADEVMAELRISKDRRELKRMRQAVEITEAALKETVRQIETSTMEREIAARLRQEMLRRGGESAVFDPIVSAGANAASPHASPGGYAIQPGDTIVIDCGTSVDGYVSDITRTFAIGELEPEMARIYEVVRAANAAGRAKVKPGIPVEDIDRAARVVIEEAGYGQYFTHRTGHGLGLEVHEPPYIVEGNKRCLEPGMTFTIEPGIYLPGKGGVRIEDDILVTPDGAESLTTFPREFNPL